MRNELNIWNLRRFTESQEYALKKLLLIVAMAIALGASIVEARGIEQFIPPEWSDLFAPWLGAKIAIGGADPYSAETTREIQRRYYGYVLEPGAQKDRQAFVYPLPVVFFLAPFTLLSWTAVRLLFTVLGPLCLAGTVWMWIKLCGFDMKPLRIVAVLILALTCWPAVWGYLTQQPTLLILGVLSAALLLYRRGWDVAAGIVLASALVKPNLAVPLLVWLVWVAVSERRWKFVLASGASICALLLGSEWMDLGWFSRWVSMARQYSAPPAKALVLLHLFGRTGGEVATLALVLGTCLYLWKLGVPRVHTRNFSMAAAMVLAITACIIPDESWMVYNQVLLIPAALLIVRARPAERWIKLLRWLGLAAIYGTLLLTLVCAALLAVVGYNKILVLLPFQTLFVPPMIALAMFSLRPESLEGTGSANEPVVESMKLAFTAAVGG